MKTEIFSPRQALNKAFLRVKPNRSQVEKFQTHLRQLLGSINETESEEFHKNLLADFLKHSYYSPQHFINTKGRNDLVILDILAAVKRTAIPHHATFLEWSLNGVDASRDAASLTEVLRFPPRPFKVSECPPATLIFSAALMSRS
jgi:hypothetical protein